VAPRRVRDLGEQGEQGQRPLQLQGQQGVRGVQGPVHGPHQDRVQLSGDDGAQQLS